MLVDMVTPTTLQRIQPSLKQVRRPRKSPMAAAPCGSSERKAGQELTSVHDCALRVLVASNTRDRDTFDYLWARSDDICVRRDGVCAQPGWQELLQHLGIRFFRDGCSALDG